MTVQERNVEAVRRFHDAWNRGDLEGCLQYVDPESSYVCGMGKVRIGHDGFREMWFGAEPVVTSRIEAESVIAANGAVIAQTISHLTPTEETRKRFPTLPSSFEIRHVDVMEMREGRIIGGRTYNSLEHRQPDDDVQAHSGGQDPIDLVLENYTNFSDERLKVKIIPIRDALAGLLTLTHV